MPVARDSIPATTRILVIGGAVVMAVALIAVLMLWSQEGPALFFEMLMAGIMSCF